MCVMVHIGAVGYLDLIGVFVLLSGHVLRLGCCWVVVPGMGTYVQGGDVPVGSLFWIRRSWAGWTSWGYYKSWFTGDRLWRRRRGIWIKILLILPTV